MAATLKTLIVPPTGGGVPNATVFLIHGLGDTAQGWVDVARMLGRQPALHSVRFVLPTAPLQPVTLNMGTKMTSWFDSRSSASFPSHTVYSLTDLDQAEDEKGLLHSTELVHGLVQQELNGTAPGLDGHSIPSSRIVVAGFSQGGAISLLTGLTSPVPLAGIAALSTWLPLRAKIVSLRKNQAKFPIFQAHGTSDQIVDYKFGEMTHEGLRDQLQFGSAAEFHRYPGMAHSACPEEITDLGTWLEKVLPPS